MCRIFQVCLAGGWVSPGVPATDEHTVTVPAHNLPLKSASASVANPLVTVYVPVPTTIYVPVPTTVTVVSVSTLTVPTTITITVPVTVGDPPVS